MTLDLALPPGDPAALRSFAGVLRALGHDLSHRAEALSVERSRLGDGWSGTAAGRATASVAGLGLVTSQAAAAMGTGAVAVADYARALDDGICEVLVLRRRRADADAELEHGLAVVRRSELDPVAHARAVASLHATHRSRMLALARDRERVTEEGERAGLRLRRALEDTRGPVVRGHRESLEDYAGGIVSSLLGRLPVLAEHPDAVQALVWASMSSLPSAARAATTAQLLGSHLAAVHRWNGQGAGPAFRPSNLPLWARTLQSRVPSMAALLAADNPLTGTAALRGTSLGGIAARSSSGVAFGGHVGGFRALGLAGAATATVTSTLNVVVQGHPVDAYRENGASYAADVSEMLLNGSVVALLVAPSPITAGAVVVSGTLYAAAEVWAHREQIAALATDGVRLAQDVARRGVDLAGDVLGTVDLAVDEAVDGAVDHARRVGSALNPFD